MTRDLRVFDRISDAVGWTPLVRLHGSVAGHGPPGAEVWAKLEMLNPMGSVKDRVARHMIEAALADGRLAAGDTVVENSSGNTAMGLAMMSILHGLGCRMVVRRQASPEKLDSLRALGVELELVDAELPPEHPESYNRRARRLAAELPGAYFPDQHNNRENNQAHYATTGPEIWRQMEGRIDWLVAGIGTGGTVSGVGRYLKEQDPSIRVLAIDVEGSIFTEHFKTGRHGRPGRYRLEGLGDEEMIGCPELEVIDEMFQVADRDAFLAARELALRDAVLAGGSSGAALWGVRRLLGELAAGAAEGAPPPRIVTLFPDSGARYLSTIFNDAWMRANGYL